MGLYVSTTGADVSIPELGFTVTHPSTDQDLSSQFEPEYLRNAISLTTAIRGGTLIWRKSAGGSIQPPTDYDSDYISVDNENTGLGLKADRVVTFKDLTAGSLVSKAGAALISTFTGNPKKAAVVFTAPMASANYSINISGVDGRIWTWESRSASGFTINTNANQALSYDVSWDVTANGETS